MSDVAAGLDGISKSIDPDRIGKLGASLGGTAKFIDETLLPASDRIADQFDQTAKDLSTDSSTLADLLHNSKPDLKAARDIYDSLGRFDDGLDKMIKLIELKRLGSIKEGFSGLETSLDTTAGQVEKLAGYTYPSVKVRGLRVEVEEKPFWPDGEKIAEGLRKATRGIQAAQGELDDVAKNLPAVRKSLEESRKVVAQTRSVIGQTLKQQDKLEKLLQDIPAKTSKMAEDLPKLAREMAKLLRQTKQLREISEAMRTAQKGFDTTVAHWPDLRKSLQQTAELLRTSANQLDDVLKSRSDYEASLKQSTELADTFARMVPLLATQVSSQLSEQEKSLDSLEGSLDDVGDTIPDMKRSAVETVIAAKALAWLFAGIVAVHGMLLIMENRGKRSETLPQ